ncbi:MAG: hypothetical protein DI534_11255 [Leifsonia xyli]|nr:MAG: hypothetical protein DI534_11255 [Leifsonia xyli]
MNEGDRFAAARQIAVVDVETTGLDPRTDRVVSIAILALDLSEFVSNGGGRIDRLTARFNPGRKIPAAASRVHGIYDRDVAAADRFEADAAAIAGFIGSRTIVGHNCDFDVEFLKAEFVRATGGFPLAGNRRLCTMKAMSEVHGRRVSLDEACRLVGTPGRKGAAHDALEDVLLTLQVAGGVVKMRRMLQVNAPASRARAPAEPTAESTTGPNWALVLWIGFLAIVALIVALS